MNTPQRNKPESKPFSELDMNLELPVFQIPPELQYVPHMTNEAWLEWIAANRRMMLENGITPLRDTPVDVPFVWE